MVPPFTQRQAPGDSAERQCNPGWRDFYFGSRSSALDERTGQRDPDARELARRLDRGAEQLLGPGGAAGPRGGAAARAAPLVALLGRVGRVAIGSVSAAGFARGRPHGFGASAWAGLALRCGGFGGPSRFADRRAGRERGRLEMTSSEAHAARIIAHAVSNETEKSPVT